MYSFKEHIESQTKIENLDLFIEKNKIEKYIIEIFIDILEVEKTKDFLKIDHNKRKVHYNLSISTKERIQLSNMLAILYPKVNFITQFQGIFPVKVNNIPFIHNELNTNGFYVFDNLLSEENCNKLVSSLEKVTFHTKKSTKKLKRLTKQTVSKINGNTAWATNQQDILQIEEVQKIAFDENLLNLVGSFLGAEPILCQTNCWWSISNSTHRSNLSTNAQLFHQDTEYLKFIKVFIYLTDVGENNGPHQYVKGSSKIVQAKMGKNYKPSDRIEDQKVIELFGKENILTFTGKKGSIIIEDTFGLHKGTPVVEGSRLLLQLEYCNSLYFHAGYTFGFENLDIDVIKLSKKYPRIFSNFTKNSENINKQKFYYYNKRSLLNKIKDKVKSYL